MSELKLFVKGFFENLKCSLIESDGILTVSNVPADFEALYEKKGPYYLSFLMENNKEHTEFIAPGSYMIQCIKDYLANKGKNTLIKLEIEDKEVINLKLGNCKAVEVNKKEEYNAIKRFSFSSVFQYINDKQQETTQIYVLNNKLIDFKIEDYKTSEGKKEDIEFGDIKQDYAIAKEKLSEIIKKKTEELSIEINEKLEKEIARIKQHFINQLQEKQDEIVRARKLLANNKERTKEGVAKLQETINFNIEEFKEKAKKEEDFLIKDEIRKHSLNIGNKLLNTSIIYYPKFVYDVTLDNGEIKRSLIVKYDPITKQLEMQKCACGNEIGRIILNTCGHFSCEKCCKKCLNCNNDYCLSCLTKKCYICDRPLCKRCVSHCSKCGKNACSMHIRKEGMRRLCNNCSHSEIFQASKAKLGKRF